MTNAQNRRRWATDQRKRADAKFAATISPVADCHSNKLAGLRQLAASLDGFPHMATTLASVRAEIDRLSQT